MGKLVRKRRFVWFMQTVDAALLLMVWIGVFVGTNITVTDVRSSGRGGALGVVAAVVILALFHRRGIYSGRPTLPRTEEISRLVTSVAIGAATTVVVAQFLDWQVGAWEILVAVPATIVVLTLARGFFRTIVSELTQRDQPERVVVVGGGVEAKEIVDLITTHPEAGFACVGVIGNVDVAEASGLGDRWLGDVEDLVVLMHRHSVSGAIVCSTGFRAEAFRSISSELLDAGYDVQLSTGVTRLWTGRFEVRSLSHEPLVVMGHRRPLSRWELAIKRAIDVVGAVVALLLFAPVMLAVAAAIKLEDRGPVFFRQQRAGKDAEFFGMIKFRSMVTNAEELKAMLAEQNERSGPLFKMTDDPRITRVGRVIRGTSLDELPQLLNVLKGDMSLVGPRPALVEEEAAFDGEMRERFDVRPGITGLWQVEARSNAEFGAYKRLDLHYVENWSLGLDLRILLATAEQTAVSLLLAPVTALLGRNSQEAIRSSEATESDDADSVIDLRERAVARARATPASPPMADDSST